MVRRTGERRTRRPPGRKGQKKGPPPRQGREIRDLSQPEEDVELIVYAPEDGMRIDRFLSERLWWRSRAQSVQLLADGRVQRNGAIIRKPSRRVSERDRIRVEVPEPAPATAPGDVPLEIVYQDAHLLALNKQAGLVCHPVGKIRSGTLMNALHARFRRPDVPEADIVPRLCHRLDRDTSGVILVALSERVRRRMQWIFESKVVCKEYLALCEGHWERDYDEVHLPIGRAGPEAEIRISMAVRTGGAPSRTIVCVEERFLPGPFDGGFTLLRCSPVTGRQHQIRVHLAAKGHPIVGDSIYGSAPETGFGFLREEAPTLGRQFLHARRIQLPHPVVPGGELDLTAPLPADLRATLAALRAR